ncbi:telomerase reverse transcriptase [Enteropsectra breve]|nr:telomerase reverse transcriptase [Enteropsectra breve]
MEDLLENLDFVPLSHFTKKAFKKECNDESIYVKCVDEVPLLSTASNLTPDEIIERASAISHKANTLSNGYKSTTRQWNGLNTTISVLKTNKWTAVFKAIGDEYSIFLLTKCHVIERINGSLVLVAGDFSKLGTNTESAYCVKRDVLLHKKQEILPLDEESIISFITEGITENTKLISKLRAAIVPMVAKYNKLRIYEMVNSFHAKKEAESAQSVDALNDKCHDTNRSKKNVSPMFAPSGVKSDPPATNIYKSAYSSEWISDFLFLISKKILKSVFSFDDFQILKGKLVLLVKRNANEGISNEELKKYFRITKLKMFGGYNQSHFNTKATAIVARFIPFIFNSIYIPIISHFFYTSTVPGRRNKLFYFKRTDWNKEADGCIAEYLKRYSVQSSVPPKAASLRCMLKPSGYRIIANCSKPARSKESKENRYSSINHELKPLLFILRRELERNRNFSALGYSDMHALLGDYLSSMREPLFVVKVDISDCFDNILKEDLLQVIDSHFKDAFYCVSDYCALSKETHSADREIKKMTCAFPSVPQIHNTDFQSISKYRQIVNNILEKKRFNEFRDSKNNCFQSIQECDSCEDKISSQIVIKEVKHRLFCRTEIVKRLANLINSMAISYKGKFYKANNGIPQGCILSTQLCMLYYAAFDKKYFEDVFKKGTMCRYVDDIIIITPDFSEIINFFEITRQNESKGFKINPDKIDSNFNFEKMVGSVYKEKCALQDTAIAAQYGEKISLIAENEESRTKALHEYPSAINDSSGADKNCVTWCGLKIYDRGFAIKPVLQDGYFRYGVSLPSEKPGAKIFFKLLQSFAIKTNHLLINKRNRKLGENIYEIMFFLARRTKLLFLRAHFINREYIGKILSYLKLKLHDILNERNIKIDSRKVEEIVAKAYAKAGVFNIEKNPFKR